MKAKESQKKNKFGYKEIESQKKLANNNNFDKNINELNKNEESSSSFITNFDVDNTKQDPIKEFSENHQKFTETKSDIKISNKSNKRKNSESKFNKKIYQY